MNVRAHPMNYARRQQYRRLLRAGEAATGGTIVALLGLAAASVGAASVAAALLVAAVALGVYSRHWISLARRSAVGARSEDAVQRALAPLQAEGWRLRHSLVWRGQGDIDSVAIAPTGIAIAIETKTSSYDGRHLARVRDQARWLSRRRRRWARNGALAIMCLVHARGVERVEDDVLVISIDRLTHVLAGGAIARALHRAASVLRRHHAPEMKAVTCLNAELRVEGVESPQPGPGHVLLEVTRCGICGSDLHARHHCDELAEVMVEIGYPGFMRSDQRVVFGHEFAGRVADYGPGCRKELPTGTDVVALPLVRRGEHVHALGLSAEAPGAYAEQVLVEESMMMPVPNGLAPDLSALTEPLAVGWHAVRRSEIGKRDVAIVVGCGPIGLAVISGLKAKGVRTVVASDLSAARRQLASACGADLVVDPSADSPYDRADQDHLKTLPAAVELAMSTMEKLRRLPVPWQHVWRTVDTLGISPRAQ